MWQKSIRVNEKSNIGELRRQCVSLCHKCGLSETETGNATIVVSELGTNLVRHVTSGGEVVIRALGPAEGNGVEIISLDKGPGIYDLDKVLAGGFSTAGGMGEGLSAVQRLSSEFDVYTQPGRGTAILSRLIPQEYLNKNSLSPYQTGIICLPKINEEVSGDNWATKVLGDRVLFMVADGLGHGLGAATAANAAAAVFHKNAGGHTQEIIAAIHLGLSHTRGAAVAIAEINLLEHTLSFTGIGNVAARILQGKDNKHLVSHNGTAGLEARKIQEFKYPWQTGNTLVMSSDGLRTHWELSSYVGILNHHPALIAGLLYRDYTRGNDDVTVLVTRRRD